MITDALLQLSGAQNITTTTVSANCIEIGTPHDTGPGEAMEVAITIDQTFVGGTSLNVQFVTSASGNLTSPNVLNQTGPIAASELTNSRYPIILRLPRALLKGLPIGQRYLGLQYTVAGTFTAGALTANLLRDAADIKPPFAMNTPII